MNDIKIKKHNTELIKNQIIGLIYGVWILFALVIFCFVTFVNSYLGHNIYGMIASLFMFFISFMGIIEFELLVDILENKLETRELKNKLTSVYYTNLVIEKKLDELNTKYHKIDESLNIIKRELISKVDKIQLKKKY